MNNQETSMLQQTIIITNKLGLHARASAKLVARSNRYSSEILIKRNNQTVNGKSILGVMMLAATQNTEIILMIEGEDENQAMEDLITLITERFGETE
jgi:phosphocarrier protein HPr